MQTKKIATRRHKNAQKVIFRLVCLLCLLLAASLLSQAEGKYTLDQVFSKMDEMQKDFSIEQPISNGLT